MERYLQRKTSQYRRVIAVSDIHGNASVFRSLLSDLHLTDDDLFVLVGDYINRGKESIETLRIVMDLAQRENVVVLKGNMDRLIDWYLWRGEEEELLAHFADYRRGWGVLFDDWAAECGFPLPNAENFAEIRAVLQKKHAAEAAFIRDLPFGLETEDHIFVHAGIAPVTEWRASTEQQMLKNDSFLAHGANPTGKTVVVGHTPVWNSMESENTNNPIFFHDRHVIGIDGGIGVKDFSQLNALVITHDGDGYRYETRFADEYPRTVARRNFVPEKSHVLFKDMWPDYHLERLEVGADFSYCRLTGSGREGWAKNEHIGTDENGWRFVRSSVSSLLPVTVGEELAVLDGTCGNFAYVKNASGRIGWVPRDVVDAE
ncbi:MAG: serine/threonine protein phosphatase [Clostridia bacterium]|nr:serine/threonine protein phosphatase [Clostridia bacterium]